MEKFWIGHNTPSSKNSRTWTGKFLVMSKSCQKWLKLSKEDWIKQKEDFRRSVSNIERPIRMEFKFYRGSKRRFDYINALQIVLDTMVKNEWIEDDNADVILPSFAPYEYNKNKPGVQIKIIK